MEPLRQYLASRTTRERRFLIAAAVFLAVALFWFGAYEPLGAAGAKAERALPELRRQAAEMQRLADEAGKLKAKAAPMAIMPEAQVLQADASRHGVTARVTQSGDGGFDVRLDAAPMAGVVEWLAALGATHRLYAREVRLSAAGAGLVGGSLVLGQ